jgi:two-component system, cell cycle sensor histidine kinase and response regulator CckA
MLRNIDQFARTAHEFNDLLTAIIGYTDLSLRQVGLEDPLRHNLEETKRAAERAASLLHQLRSLSREQKANLVSSS